MGLVNYLSNQEDEIQGVDFSGDAKELVLPGQEEKQDQAKKQEETNEQQETSSAQFDELKAEILKQGSGQAVKEGDTVSVHYVGLLADGTKFDSSRDRGQPFNFQIGAGQVIPGWDLGLVGMKLGELRRLYVPAEYGYGQQGAGEVIPPNANLIFEIELLAIK